MNKTSFAVVNALYQQVYNALDQAYAVSGTSSETFVLTYILHNTEAMLTADRETTALSLYTGAIPAGRVQRNIHLIASAITSAIMVNVYTPESTKANIKDAIMFALVPVYEVFKPALTDAFFQVDNHTDNERLGILIHMVTEEVLAAMKTAKIVRLRQVRQDGDVRTNFEFTGSFEDMVKSVTLAGLVPILPMLSAPKA